MAGLTNTGNETITGNFTVNGTDSRAPNQTMVNTNDLVTAALAAQVVSNNTYSGTNFPFLASNNIWGNTTNTMPGVNTVGGEAVTNLTNGAFHWTGSTGTGFVLQDTSGNGTLTMAAASGGGGNTSMFKQPYGYFYGNFVGLVSNTAYFCYIGYFPTNTVINHVTEPYIRTYAVGTEVAELGIFSTPSAPDGTAKVFTKLISTGTTSGFTAGDASSLTVSNVGAFNLTVAAGTYVWAGVRCAQTTSTPNMEALGYDFGVGACQTTSAAGALTGAGPWTGVAVSPLSDGTTPIFILSTK